MPPRTWQRAEVQTRLDAVMAACCPAPGNGLKLRPDHSSATASSTSSAAHMSKTRALVPGRRRDQPGALERSVFQRGSRGPARSAALAAGGSANDGHHYSCIHSQKGWALCVGSGEVESEGLHSDRALPKSRWRAPVRK
eukprot:366566-Chlamydomonas_euryale.AAC.12